MNFIYIDLETGGFDHKLHSLLSIGAVYGEITGEGLTILSEFHSLILPAPGTSVCVDALRVQGLTWGDLDDSQYEERVYEYEGLARLSEWLHQHDAARLPIFAHNAPFDRDFLSTAIRRSAYKNTVLAPLVGRDARWSCTRFLAESLVAFKCMELPLGGTLPDGKEVKPGVSLDALCLHFGLELREGGHDALGDARLGAQVLGKLARIAGWA